MSKEQLWANCSGHSWQMSDREGFTQVAHDKWANERFAQKIWLKSNFMVCFLYVVLKNNEQFAHSLFLISEVSESLRSLTKNEWPWAKCSGCSPKMSKWTNCSLFWVNRSFAHFFAKKWAIRSENRWANSQPWKYLPLFLFLCLKLEAAPTKLQNFPLSGNSV